MTSSNNLGMSKQEFIDRMTRLRDRLPHGSRLFKHFGTGWGDEPDIDTIAWIIRIVSEDRCYITDSIMRDSNKIWRHLNQQGA